MNASQLEIYYEIYFYFNNYIEGFMHFDSNWTSEEIDIYFSEHVNAFYGADASYEWSIV